MLDGKLTAMDDNDFEVLEPAFGFAQEAIWRKHEYSGEERPGSRCGVPLSYALLPTSKEKEKI